MYYKGFENCQAANKSHSQPTFLLNVTCRAKKGSKAVPPFYHLMLRLFVHEIPTMLLFSLTGFKYVLPSGRCGCWSPLPWPVVQFPLNEWSLKFSKPCGEGKVEEGLHQPRGGNGPILVLVWCKLEGFLLALSVGTL